MIGKLILSFMLKRATRTLTGWISAGLIASGAAVQINPDIAALIPPSYRGYVVIALGCIYTAARLRREFFDELAKLKKE
jgi:hypothetical protein